MSDQYRHIAIGSGLAGLSFALHAAEHGPVCVLTKAEVAEANTSYAQGGIAAAVGEADSWKLHEEDTLVAGAGLCDVEAVRFLVQQAPSAIEWLASIGAKFDVELGGDYALGMEGGHSRHRILHFADRTGQEVERAVVDAVRRHPGITVVEHAFVEHLLVEDGSVVGAMAQVEGLGEREFRAESVLLATGGCGRMYQHTTNPRVATGDGIALALGVGAKVANMEFMQFHPTTLYHPQLRSFLITEAVRGDGATLRNHVGTRFMFEYDPRLELAPRDVVARAMEAEMHKLNTWCLYLDMAHMEAQHIEQTFPTIFSKLLEVGIDIRKQWIPVVPAQHYSCGGVVTDQSGRCTVRGLFAAGEVACTGVHGANRLASNSLLEALVFARSAARALAQGNGHGDPASTATSPRSIPEADAVRIRHSLQHTMSRNAAIVRTDAGLQEADAAIEGLLAEYGKTPGAPFSAHALETRNLLAAAKEVVRGAIARTENVGLHYNRDREPKPAS